MIDPSSPSAWEQRSQIPQSALVRLEHLGPTFWALLGTLLIALLGATDLLTGYEFSFSIFYLLPIGLMGWFAGRRLGLAASVVSAISWLLADILSGHIYSQPWLFGWNAAIRLGFFVVVTLLLAEVKLHMEHEQRLVRTDYLTGAVSVGYFYAVLQAEIDRSTRYKHPFALAYVDIDDFKVINDTLGHTTGDEVLCSVASCLRNSLRATDVVARLGGDEFGILLPEIDPANAPGVLAKIRGNLGSEMSKLGWAATFSIGAVTFMEAPTTTDKVIRMADEVMYEVKRNGKNSLKCSVYAG